MTRLFFRATIPLLLLWVTVAIIIHARPYDNQAVRAALVPPDCRMPCFMGIRPGITDIREAYKILEANPWISDFSSHIDSGCCTIALNWKWNGKQPAFLGNVNNTIYFSYNPITGAQIVQSMALHTQIPTGDVVLMLGSWPSDNSGALKGKNNAYVEVFYRQSMVRVNTQVSCPLMRWQVWQAPVTLMVSTDARNISNMKHLDGVC